MPKKRRLIDVSDLKSACQFPPQLNKDGHFVVGPFLLKPLPNHHGLGVWLKLNGRYQQVYVRNRPWGYANERSFVRGLASLQWVVVGDPCTDPFHLRSTRMRAKPQKKY